MTNPYLPNPDAALSTSASLTTSGNRMRDAVSTVVSQIEGLQASNPWGDDEVGQTYQASLGDTGEITAAMNGLGEGITGFGNIAQSGIQQILDIDDMSEKHMGGLRL